MADSVQFSVTIIFLSQKRICHLSNISHLLVLDNHTINLTVPVNAILLSFAK